jgi:hypothetical protein
VIIRAFDSAGLSPFPEKIVRIVQEAQDRLDEPVIAADLFSTPKVNRVTDAACSDNESCDEDGNSSDGDNDGPDACNSGEEQQEQKELSKFEKLVQLTFNPIKDVLYPPAVDETEPDSDSEGESIKKRKKGGGMTTAMKAAISSNYLTGRDKETCSQIQAACEGYDSVPELMAYTIGGRDDDPTRPYSVVLPKIAHDWFVKSTVIPAQELTEVLDKQKRLKKANSIPKTGRMSLKNPSTTTGQQVTAELMNHLDAQADEREKREEDKAAQKSVREQKGRAQAVADEKLWLLKVADSSITLEKLLRPELTMCHRHVLKKSTSAKKDDIVDALLPHWEQARAALAVDTQAGVVDI